MILGEILEHVPNPVDFLKAITVKYYNKVKSIIITAPNAWGRKWEKALNNNVEFINSDHYYWFTPYTLGRVMIAGGIVPQSIYFADPELSILNRAYHKISGKWMNIKSLRCSTLVGIGDLSEL